MLNRIAVDLDEQMTIQTTSQLLDFVLTRLPTPAWRSVWDRGLAKIYNLGAFNDIHKTLPGWIVCLQRLDTQKTLYIAVLADQGNLAYRVRTLKSHGDIPWQNWAGDITGDENLTNGQMPFWCWLKQCAALKLASDPVSKHANTGR